MTESDFSESYYKAKVDSLKNGIVGQDKMITARDKTIRELNDRLLKRQWIAYFFATGMFVAGILVGWWIF